jgi:5S rRNA maturation endonuclease (ribonuclease M5)
METILEWADALRESEKAVIVEGPRDKLALEVLGVRRIHMLHKRPVFALVEEVAQCCKKAVILTDLDKEGKKLYGIISSGLQMHGVQVDNKFREWLQNNTKVSHIEGLSKIGLA